MLTGVEYEQCEILLRQLSLQALKSLADTVTRKMIPTENKEDSISVILKFSNSAKELLLRKKMKREYLFLYLHQAGVAFDPKSDKDVLIKVIHGHWAGSAFHPHDIQQAAGDVASSCIVISDDENQEQKEGDVKAFIQDFYQQFNDMANADKQSNLLSNSLSSDCKFMVYATVNSSYSCNLYKGVEDVLRKFHTLAGEFYFRRGGNLEITNDGEMVNVHESGGIYSHEKTGKFNQTFHLRTTAVQNYQITYCELNMHT